MTILVSSQCVKSNAKFMAQKFLIFLIWFSSFVKCWTNLIQNMEANWISESVAQMLQFLSQQLSVPVTNVRLADKLPPKIFHHGIPNMSPWKMYCNCRLNYNCRLNCNTFANLGKRARCIKFSETVHLNVLKKSWRFYSYRHLFQTKLNM